MPSLPHRRPAGRAGAAALLLSAGALGLSGCGSVGRTLSQREVVVIFSPDRTPADVDRVRAACDGVGGAKAQPAGKDNAANRRYPLRFDVSGLSLQARSRLVGCLSKDPKVRGYSDSESTTGG